MYSEENTSIAPEILPYVEEGDTLVYENKGDVDSFFVEKAILYSVGEGDGEGDESWKYERYISSMFQIDCFNSCYKLSTTITPIEYWIGVFGYVHSSYTLVSYDKRFADLTCEIGNYQLKELYGSYNLEPDSITGNEINYVLYSKKYGFVEYKLTNGETYTLSKESLEKLMTRKSE